MQNIEKQTYQELENKLALTEQALAKAIAQNELQQACCKIDDLKYKNYYTKAPFAYQALDAGGLILDVNPKWCEETGFVREEIIGTPFSAQLTDESRAVFEDAFTILVEKGHISDIYLDIRTKSGDIITAKYAGCSITENDGKFSHTNCVLQNVTAQIQAENEIKLSNKRLEVIIELYNHNSKNITVLLNIALQKSLDLTDSNIGYIYFYNEDTQLFTLHAWSNTAMSECKIVMPNTTYELQKTGCWGEAIRQRKPFMLNNFESPNPHKKGLPEGHVTLQKFLTLPIFFNDKIVAVIGVGNKKTNYAETDIRQLDLLMRSVWDIVKLAEYRQLLIQQKEEAEIIELQALENQARLKLAQEGARVGLWEWHLDRDVIYWSDTTYEIFGRKKHDEFFLNDEFFSFIHPEDKYQLDRALSEAVKNEPGKKYDFEYRIIKPNGEVRWIYEIGKPYPEAPAKPQKMLGILYEITERKQFILELQQRENELRQLNASKDKMFSIISHDLRSPFSGLLGFSELLIAGLKEHDYNRSMRYAEIIYNSGKQNYTLLENLLQWSRIQRGIIKFSSENVDVFKLVENVIDLQATNIKSKQLNITNKITKDFILEADLFMLETIFRNLISNAIKYTENCGKIAVSSSENEEFTEFSVSDNGVGISKENMANFFNIEANYTTNGTNNEKGSGLGLLLCEDFVARHGGKILVESRLGFGSTFKFSVLKNKISL